MNKRFFLFLASILLLTSCQLDPSTPVVKPTKFDKAQYRQELLAQQTPEKKLIKKDSITKDTMTTSKLVISKIDTLLLKITYGKTKMDTAKIKGQKLVFLMNSDTAKKLNLTISSKDTLANLHIAQIIDPSGQVDGPFDQTVLYEVKEKGLHKIIVAENPKKQNAWEGKFTFEGKLAW